MIMMIMMIMMNMTQQTIVKWGCKMSYYNVGTMKEETKLKDQVVICMSVEVYNELQEYVQHFDSEVSGFGLVEQSIEKIEDEKVKQVRFDIVEVFLPSKQKNSSGYTEPQEEAIHEIMHKLVQEEKDTNKLRLHWHSHADMGVFHSGTDEDNYETMNNKEWLVSLVLNKDRAILGRVDVYNPVHFSASGVGVYVVLPNSVNDKKVKENIEALEKYESERKMSIYDDWSKERVKALTDKYNGKMAYDDYDDTFASQFGFGSTIETMTEENIAKFKRTAASKLGISKKMAKKFEGCE